MSCKLPPLVNQLQLCLKHHSLYTVPRPRVLIIHVMTSHNTMRSNAYDNVERGQYFQGHMAGLSAHERHTKLVSDYQRFYQNAHVSKDPKPAALVSTDFDALREGHRFLRSEADDAETSWEAKLAKRYYSRLYREYAVADLSRCVIWADSVHCTGSDSIYSAQFLRTVCVVEDSV